jgi:hypothetical protein
MLIRPSGVPMHQDRSAILSPHRHQPPQWAPECLPPRQRPSPLHHGIHHRVHISHGSSPRLQTRPVKDCEHLRKWSSHSLRVGACGILHGMGFTNSQIRLLLLRWRSDAFFDCLRNIAGLAFKQCRALHHDLSIMPNFV